MCLEWAEVELGDVAHVSWGDTSTTKASYVPSGYPAYSATGQDGYLDHYDHEGPGIILSAIGAQCGKVWFADGRWSCIKNTIYIKGLPGLADTRFLFPILSNPQIWPKRGAAQPFISQGDARKVRVSLPPFDTQQRVAIVFAVYDSLIDNSTRRIAVLKELKQVFFDELRRTGGQIPVRVLESTDGGRGHLQ